jgi:2-methylcitrate dehydratase
MPGQYSPERIARADVQELLRRIDVRPADDLSPRFPSEHACRLRVHLQDGTLLTKEKRDYEGFHTRPMSWEAARLKFDTLARGHAGADLRDRIAEAVSKLDEIEVADLTSLLELTSRPQA